MNIRAMAVLCFCPPERVTPLSPTVVSKPSLKLSIVSKRLAVPDASFISSISAFVPPRAIFSAKVLEKR